MWAIYGSGAVDASPGGVFIGLVTGVFGLGYVAVLFLLARKPVRQGPPRIILMSFIGCMTCTPAWRSSAGEWRRGDADGNYGAEPTVAVWCRR